MKTMINYALMACMAIALLAATTLNGQEWTKEQKSVWQVVEQGWEAYKTGDSEAAFADVHEKYLGWNNNEPLPIPLGKWKANYERMKPYVNIEHYDIQPARIVVTDNNAVVYYFFRMQAVYKKDDKEKSYKTGGRNVEFYVKENGKWMLLGDMTLIDDED